MESAFSVLMLCFAGALLLYAVAVALSGSTKLIPRMHAVKEQDQKRYARQFSKMMATVALAPALSGILGLLAGPGLGAMALVPAFVLTIRSGLHFFDDLM